MSHSSSPNDTSPRRNLLVVVGVVVLAGLAALVWWFTRPEAASVDISTALSGTTAPDSSATEAASSPADTSTSTAPDPGSTSTPSGDASAPAGEDAYSVTTDAVAYDFENASGTFVGFRIDEELSSVGNTTAVARTPAVTGELVLDDTTLASGSFIADMTEMTSDRSQRNGAIQRALNTSENPNATFELTEPVDLGEIPPAGEAIDVEVTGDLTVNGTTVSDTFQLQGGVTAQDLLVVTGSFDVPLADVGVQAPSAPLVVGVADVATVEFQLFLQR